MDGRDRLHTLSINTRNASPRFIPVLALTDHRSPVVRVDHGAPESACDLAVAQAASSSIFRLHSVCSRGPASTSSK